MTNFDWLKGIPSLAAGSKSDAPLAVDTTIDVTGITDVRLLRAPADPTKPSVYLVKDQDALGKLTSSIQAGLVKGANKTRISYIMPGNSGIQTVTVRASPDLPWYLELTKNLVSAFLTSGAGALALAITSLVVGSPVTLWMFLASFVALVLGIVFHVAYLKLG
ncbi:MAG: hypothetical protein LBB26_03120 [Puniceicoccales bacterium]|jgi:hypothetical protein|nr:hypothetical protein [Puniceicoccales bacterium]